MFWKRQRASSRSVRRARRVRLDVSALQAEALEARQMLAADLVSLSPADGATGVAGDSNLVMTFSEAVQAGPGTGNILIHNSSDGSVVEAVNVNSDRVTFDGATVTVDLVNNLPGDAQLHATVDPSSIRDMGAGVTQGAVLLSEDFEGLTLLDSPLATDNESVEVDNYVVIMSGVLDVKEAGDYTFGGNSDDGMWLLIDVAQDGIDAGARFDDEVILDNTTHGNQDRLSVCGLEAAVTSCVATSEEDPITLDVGEYAFEYWYFENGGGSSGEFFYAKGIQEVFDAAEFVLVGDDSKGIGVTADGITATTYKSAGDAINTLEAAEDLVDGFIAQEANFPVSEKIPTADVFNSGGSGRFTDDHNLPGYPPGTIGDGLDWTDVGPFGWVRDSSELKPDGQPEFRGAVFQDKQFWINQQGNQDRVTYTKGTGTVVLFDPDAFDDFGGIGGEFRAFISTPEIHLDGTAANTLKLEFDSSYRPEGDQTGLVDVSFDGGATFTNLLTLNNDTSGGANSLDRANESVSLSVENPTNGSAIFRFGMTNAGNNWWWAIDNVKVTADVTGSAFVGITDDSWSFNTGEGGPVDPVSGPINLATGTAAQSSQLGSFVAENALDDVANFTHTDASDENPTWQVLLGDSYAFDAVTVFNRGASEGTLSCCPSRLRDITIQIVSFEGDATTDFTGGQVVYSSELLNPENEIGGGADNDGPISLMVDAGGAVGNMIRVIRTPDPDLSGTGGAGNADEGSVLSIDLVTAIGKTSPGTDPVLSDITSPGDAIVLVNGQNDGDDNDGAPPAGEIVDHVIDDVTQKYLNFLDLNSGFAVTPSVGPTVVSGLRLYTANDAVERDPASYKLEGGVAGDAKTVGDLDGSGSVDFADFLVLSANFGKSPAVLVEGDLNENGTVDFPDFLVLSSNFGKTVEEIGTTTYTVISEGDLALPEGRNPGGDVAIDSSLFFQEVLFSNTTAYTSYRLTFPTLKNAAAANSMQIAEVELLGVIA